MVKKNIIFLHGFASSGKGTKGDYLLKRYEDDPDVTFSAFEFTPTLVDFEYLTVTGMINRLNLFVLDMKLEPFMLVGSSFGALVGMNYAGYFGGVTSALLLAPALSYSTMAPTKNEEELWRSQGAIEVFHYAFNRTLSLGYELETDGQQYREAPPPTGPVTIIHGTGDEVVPVEHSRRYAAQHPENVTLIEVDAGHDLNEHLGLIGRQVDALGEKKEEE